MQQVPGFKYKPSFTCLSTVNPTNAIIAPKSFLVKKLFDKENTVIREIFRMADSAY